MSELNEKDFERIGNATRGAAKVGEKLFGGIVKKLGHGEDRESLDWASDADWAQLQQEPLRARSLLRIAGVVLVLLLIWAAFAEVDEVTRGEAKVVPTSQVQIIQSVDGGVVEDIMVREGQIVDAGQLLLRVDPTRFASSLGESRASQLALRAKAERLQALTQGARSTRPPICSRMRPISWRTNVVSMSRAGQRSAPRFPSPKVS